MYQNDINFHFKTVGGSIFCDTSARSFHGRQNLLWGGDKKKSKGRSQQKFSSYYGKSALGGQNIFS
jgi:hypothetical protein